MKKSLICIITLTIICLAACSNTGANNSEVDLGISKSETNIEVLQKEIACEITTNSDYNKLAMNFNELIHDADFILKIMVKDVNAFIEVYKGSYNNEKLYVNGGEMLHEEFYQNEAIKKAVSGHEDLNNSEQYKGKYVRQIVDNQYIFNPGEEYIFFAKQREENKKYYSLYAYQGTFKLIDGMVENTALDNSEPLKDDICNIFNLQSEEKSSENSYLMASLSGKTTNSEIAVSEKIFAEKIKDLK